MATIDLEALRAELEAEKKAAAIAALSEDEKQAHALLEERAKIKEARAAAERARREVDAGTREATARKAAGGKYLVRALDLVSFFPFGESPPIEQLPCGGVIVVRSPTPETSAEMTREVDARKRTYEAILIDVLIASVVDPAPVDVAGSAMLRPFFEAYTGAGVNAAGIVLELGGLKQKADKRGRS